MSERASTLAMLMKVMRRLEVKVSDLVMPLVFWAPGAVCEAVTIGLMAPLISRLIARPETLGTTFVLYKRRIELPPALAAPASGTIFLAALIFAAVVGRSLLDYRSNVLLRELGHKNVLKLRDAIARRTLSFGKLYFERHNASVLQEILLGFSRRIAEVFGEIHRLSSAIVLLAVYGFVLVTISWRLTVSSVIFLLLLRYVVYRITRAITLESQAAAGLEKQVSQKASEMLRSVALIKLYSREQAEADEFRRVASDAGDVDLASQRRVLLIRPIHETMLQVFVLATVVVVANLVQRGELEPGPQYLVFLFALRRGADAFVSVLNIRVSLLGLRGRIEELDQIFDDHEKYFVVGRGRPFGGLARAIEVEGLVFAYAGGSPVLGGVTCTIPKAKVTAVVGASGAGKSTFIKILERLYPVGEGMVKLDGVDINEFSVESLLERVAVVDQEVLLLDASLRDNLGYGSRRPLRDEELWGALEQARLKQLVQEMPQKLETQIGERGIRLSGGERQRLAIARAILKRAEILILDEATNALDLQTERAVHAALETLMRGKTAIVIAHRLDTIRSADQIIVFDGGRVVEHGSYDTLMAARGRFFELQESRLFSEPV